MPASPPTTPKNSREAAVSEAIAAAQGRLDAYMNAFNTRDVEAFEDTFNFPHIRLASGVLTFLSPGDVRPRMYERAALKDWSHSAWLRREVIHADPQKVHIDTRVARYRANGAILSSFDSLYIVTRLGDRWGIQLRSSYAP